MPITRLLKLKSLPTMMHVYSLPNPQFPEKQLQKPRINEKSIPWETGRL
jgi:hypothetical protein